jgi:hypothetical protein
MCSIKTATWRRAAARSDGNVTARFSNRGDRTGAPSDQVRGLRESIALEVSIGQMTALGVLVL